MADYKVYLAAAPYPPNKIIVAHPGGETHYDKSEICERALTDLAAAQAEIRYLKAELKLAKISKSR